jgi:hypothetical protein
VGAAPGDQLGLVEGAEVESGVGVWLVGLGVDVELEIVAAVPVDEVNSVAVVVVDPELAAARNQPAFYRRRIDI